MNKELSHAVMKAIRQHQPIPQIGAYLPDGSPTILCKCSDINEYNSNGYSDHLTVSILDAIDEVENNH